MRSKDASTARRAREVENERAMKKLYAEQMRLRHEERLAGVQLAILEHTVKTQREQDERQNRAERDRAARRASVGKVAPSAAEAMRDKLEGGGGHHQPHLPVPGDDDASCHDHSLRVDGRLFGWRTRHASRS